MRMIAVLAVAGCCMVASAPGGDTYAEALRELFELDPQAVDAVAAGELPLAVDGPDSAG